MYFESAMWSICSAANNEKEYKAELKKWMYPGEINRKRLESAMQMAFPNDDVMVTDKKEQKRRAQLSQKLREKMDDLLHENFLSYKVRSVTKRKQLVRAVSADTLLNLPYFEQNKIYELRRTA